MSLDKIFDNIERKPKNILKRELSSLFRSSVKYKNLDKDNQNIIFDLFEKFIDKKKKSHTINSLTISSEMRNLRKSMSKSGLTHEDLKDIEEIISEFKN